MKQYSCNASEIIKYYYLQWSNMRDCCTFTLVSLLLIITCVIANLISSEFVNLRLASGMLTEDIFLNE